MTTRPFRAVGLAVAASLVLASDAVAQPRAVPAVPPPAIAEFSHRLAAYVELTKKATEKLPPLKRTDDPAEIAAREIALGSAIRAARAASRRGDILTLEAARIIRGLIKTDFRNRPPDSQKLMRDEIPHFHPRVNQSYPSEWPLATFPVTLLAVLPQLPEGLEYRLLSETLILRDVKANVIVDFILDVF
jgi:hypothetical protein